jgi:hypothetical protein
MQVTGSNERNSHRVTDSHRSPNSSRVMVRAFASCRLGKLGDHVASNTFSFFLKKTRVMFGLGGKKSQTTLGQAMMGREQGLLDPAPRTRDDPIPQPGGSSPSSSPSQHLLASD